MGLTAGEAAPAPRLPREVRTTREPTQPLSLGPPRNSKETLGKQAEKAVVDAETPRAGNIQAQTQGLPDEAAERGSPAWKLKISALASRKSEEAIQPSLGTSRETSGNEAKTAAVAETSLPRNIQAQEEGRAGEATRSTSSAWKSKILALLPKGGEAIPLSLPAPKETPNDQTDGSLLEAVVPRSRYLQAPEQGRAEEAAQHRSRNGKLKTSALVLAGAAIVGAIPTQLRAPRHENAAASSDVAGPLLQRSAESVDVNVVNSERQVDLNAKPSLESASAPAAVGINEPALGVFSATPVAASTSAVTAPAAAPRSPQLPDPNPAVSTPPDERPDRAEAPSAGGSPPRDETPLATQVPSASDSAEVPFAVGAPIPPARPAKTEPGLKRRHEVSSPDVIPRTIAAAPGAAADRRSHPLALKSRTKPEIARRAGKRGQEVVEPSEAPDAADAPARQAADPLQLGDPVSRLQGSGPLSRQPLQLRPPNTPAELTGNQGD